MEMAMDASDVAAMTNWDGNGLGHLHLYLPLLGEQIAFVLFPDLDADPIVTDKMAATIADVIKLGPEHLQRVKDMLWDEARFSFQVADYGVEAEEGETPLEAHLRAFGIAGPDDAYRKSTICEVHIGDKFEARFAELMIDTGAENRISIIIKNGVIVDWDDDGTHLGWFDADEQAAAKKRARVLL